MLITSIDKKNQNIVDGRTDRRMDGMTYRADKQSPS